MKKLEKSWKVKVLMNYKETLKKLDEKSYEEIDLSNKLRLVRAIEVCLLTGGKFSELRTQNIKNNDYDF